MADVLESVVECYSHAANIGATREQNGKTIFLEWYLYLDNHAFVSEFFMESLVSRTHSSVMLLLDAMFHIKTLT